MTETFLDGRVTLHPGDCLEVLARLPECSVDSVVTDPPYHLTSIAKRFATVSERDIEVARLNPHRRTSSGFMGKQWDGGDIAFTVELWKQVWRVLKPGGHLVAFGGTRTYHRMACAIEDAGFEIRDCIQWIYGSGFPKSHDVSKGIDRAAGAERGEVVRIARGGVKPNGGYGADGTAGLCEADKWREVTAPATDAARQWEGWGTALKPACEPIVLARKPLSEGTVAANVLRWGTGAINVDGCRIVTSDKLGGGAEKADTDAVDKVEGWDRPWMHDPDAREAHSARVRANVEKAQSLGRWPANLIHDGSEEVIGAFPESSITGARTERSRGAEVASTNWLAKNHQSQEHLDSGSAARFFYTAKADQDDRLGSKHPTVKPLDLMQYLVRLVTPPRGVVLDPFAGTGTTGEAAWREGFSAILIEREEEYQADIRRRMALALAGPDEKLHAIVKAKGLTADPGPLFGGEW